MKTIDNEDIYKSVVNDIRNNPFIQTKRWMKGFSVLSNTMKTDILKEFHELQKDCIIDGMEALEDSIHLPGFGRFVLNKGRKEYVELMKEDNNLSHEEIQKIVVENFITRHKQNKQKKLWKNKG